MTKYKKHYVFEWSSVAGVEKYELKWDAGIGIFKTISSQKTLKHAIKLPKN
jgi:hypothetical protein